MRREQKLSPEAWWRIAVIALLVVIVLQLGMWDQLRQIASDAWFAVQSIGTKSEEPASRAASNPHSSGGLLDSYSTELRDAALNAPRGAALAASEAKAR